MLDIIFKALLFILNSLKESMGHPVTLLRLLHNQPEIRVDLQEPSKVISAHSVIQWPDWGNSWNRSYNYKRGAILGYGKTPYGYASIVLQRPEFEQFGHCEVEADYECDIQEISGFAASKSNLHDFTNLDDMVEKNSPEMIDSITEEKMHKNLAHTEIGILHSKSDSDHFARHLWDGRVFLINSGGSHHFAAARYIAARIGKSVPLKGAMHTYMIDPKAVASLRRDFDMFVMSDNAYAINGFMDAMRAFNATFYWQPLPRPYEQGRVILLPKKEARSTKVAAILREAGLFDLGIHLTGLVNRQASQLQS